MGRREWCCGKRIGIKEWKEIEGKKRICCGKRMGRREWKE
jgi:hypothetical protein